MKKKITTEEAVENIKKVWGDKYDYSKTVYEGSKTKLTLTCPEHGDFQVFYKRLLKGIGCPECAKYGSEKQAKWIERLKKTHGDRYDYSKTVYKGPKEKIEIICHVKDDDGNEHGPFFQNIFSHLSGCGCPKCNKGVSLTFEDFVKQANKVHKNFYDYSKFKFVNYRTKGTITCPIHGDFEQSPYLHATKGRGCPQCKSSVLENILIRKFNQDGTYYLYQYPIKGERTLRGDFYLPQKNLVIECQGEQHFTPTTFYQHGDKDKDFEKVTKSDREKYDYCMSSGINVVYYTMPSHFHVEGVDVHSGFYADKMVFETRQGLIDYIDSLPDVESDTWTHYRDFIARLKEEIPVTDIPYVVKSDRFEYKEHVVMFIPLREEKKTHLIDIRKSLITHGKKPLLVYEDEYTNHPEIVIGKIKHACGLCKDSLPKVPGRKVDVREVGHDEARAFLDANHIQGFANATVHLGAFFEDRLIAVMSFHKESKRGKKWTLTRFASDMGYICQGVGGKLFKHFIRTYDFDEIKTFADRRWTPDSADNFYTHLGFKEVGYVPTDYSYFNFAKDGCHRLHKFSFRKTILHNKYGLPMDMTETEMTKKLGYKRIWNCGLIKYVWYNDGEGIERPVYGSEVDTLPEGDRGTEQMEKKQETGPKVQKKDWDDFIYDNLKNRYIPEKSRGYWFRDCFSQLMGNTEMTTDDVRGFMTAYCDAVERLTLEGEDVKELFTYSFYSLRKQIGE